MQGNARKLRPQLNSLEAVRGHTEAHWPQPVHLSLSIYLGWDRRLAVKLPASPSMASTSVFVMILMFICRPTSTSFGEMTHIAQSLVGKVLSS